jgi:hypothetical protein
MIHRATRHLLWFCVLLLAAGCAVNRTSATVNPDLDLAKAKRFYVVKNDADSRGTDKLIADRLTKLGYAATRGPQQPAPYNADVVVTYTDKWMWDMTMYMLELSINFRTPDTGFPLATGNSLHTSLTRKSPEEMVDEVLASIFDKAKQNR